MWTNPLKSLKIKYKTALPQRETHIFNVSQRNNVNHLISQPEVSFTPSIVSYPVWYVFKECQQFFQTERYVGPCLCVYSSALHLPEYYGVTTEYQGILFPQAAWQSFPNLILCTLSGGLAGVARYSYLLYGWVCFRHAIGQFAVRSNLLYGPKFLKKMLISEL